jgi:hypothetical protein
MVISKINIEMIPTLINYGINKIGCFTLASHIFMRDKDHKMNLKRHASHLITSSWTCCITIIFYNVNNNSKHFHKLQINYKFIIHGNHKFLDCKFVMIYHQAMTFVTKTMLFICPYNWWCSKWKFELMNLYKLMKSSQTWSIMNT